VPAGQPAADEVLAALVVSLRAELVASQAVAEALRVELVKASERIAELEAQAGRNSNAREMRGFGSRSGGRRPWSR
jgi:hypothetical protein